MTLQDVIVKASGAQAVRLPACPQCGDTLLAPLLAEHVGAGLVHNHWVCESCGHAFRKAHEYETTDFDEALA
jgi:ribosomal protein L37AE/L43A